ncbi:MAG: SPOR domain-containing protein [bacterium]|nr:SPOR domain-containing protein [bacterium]
MNHRNRPKSQFPLLPAICLFILFAALSPPTTTAQQGMQAYERGDLAKAAQYLNSGKLPGDEAEFLQAALCTEADSAATLYRAMVLHYPESPYSRRAMDRLRQYYEATGDHDKAEDIKKTLKNWQATQKTLNDAEEKPAAPVVKPPVVKPAETKPDKKQEPAKKKEPPPKQPQLQQSKYNVQVGAFGSAVNARKLQDTLVKAGYQVIIIPPKAGTGKLNLVQVVGYDTEATATAAAQELADKFGLKPIVVGE